MHSALALHMMSELFWTALIICAPILGVVMLVGLLISILQVVTQVQEMSLTFVPKIVAAVMAMIAFGSWMLHKLMHYSAQLWLGIPSMF